MMKTVQVKINTTVVGTNRFMSQIAVGLWPDLKWVVMSVLLIQHGCFPTWGVKWCTRWLSCSELCSTSWRTLTEPSVTLCICNSLTCSSQIWRAFCPTSSYSVPVRSGTVPVCRVAARRIFRPFGHYFPGQPYYWPSSIICAANLTLIFWRAPLVWWYI